MKSTAIHDYHCFIDNLASNLLGNKNGAWFAFRCGGSWPTLPKPSTNIVDEDLRKGVAAVCLYWPSMAITTMVPQGVDLADRLTENTLGSERGTLTAYILFFVTKQN